MIVQRWGRSLETSVIMLWSADLNRMSGCSSGAVLCLHSGVDPTIGHIAKTWSSPAVASHPPLHDMSRRRTAAPALAPW